MKKNGNLRKSAGWLSYAGKEYFISEGGQLYQNTMLSFGTDYIYYMGPDGSKQHGLVNTSSGLYYMDETNGNLRKSAGWLSYAGKEYFISEGGQIYQNTMLSFGTDYIYYMGPDGSKQHGLVNTSSCLYYMDEINGNLRKSAGWLSYAGKEYFISEGGQIYQNTMLSFGTDYIYYMGADGSKQHGLVNTSSGLYYMDETNGNLRKSAGWLPYAGKEYFISESGQIYQNTMLSFGTDYIYYMGADGSKQHGLVNTSSGLYYMDETNGNLRKSAGWLSYAGKEYFISEGGEIYQNTMLSFGTDYVYYMGSDGSKQFGWVEIRHDKYYFDENGKMLFNCTVNINGSLYSFSSSGKLLDGYWMEEKGETYYVLEGRYIKGWNVIDGVKYLFNNEGKLVKNMSKLIIDISEYNQEIDWVAVRKSGVDGVILRCGYGWSDDINAQIDDMFLKNAEELERLNIPYGVYLFSYEDDVKGAHKEAEFTLRLIKDRKISLPVYYDLEYSDYVGNIASSVYIEMANAFCQDIENAGYTPGIYANLNYWNNKLNDTSLDKYVKWVAQYNSNNGEAGHCDYKKDYDMWQYTSFGSIPGISTRVDMNAMR